MPSTYTVNLGIEKPATGEQSGTWGDTTNVNFDILDQAINGAERVTLTSAGSSGSPNALNITNGATSDGRNKWIEFYSSGDLGGSAYVQLVPDDAEKIVFIRNSLASSRSVLLFQGTYNSGRDLEIPAGVDMVVKFDGGGASAATVTDVFTKLRATEITTPTLTATTADINGGTIDNSVIGGSTAAAVTGTTVVANTSLNIAGDGATVTGIKDEDDMSSNSATKLATQQSIKAYVDSQVGTVDTWAEVLANGATSGSTNPEVTAGQALKTNTINETSAGSGVTIDSVLLKDDVVNATDVETGSISANDGTASATIANSTGVMTIASSVLTTTDINGGSIDGTNIGASSAATGAFTTLSTTSDATLGNDILMTNNSYIQWGSASSRLEGNSSGTDTLKLYTNSTENLSITGSAGGAVVVNEGSSNLDFRVESTNNANMLFVDAGTDRVGVGTNAPAGIGLTVNGGTSVGTYFYGGTNNRRQLTFTSFDTASLDAGHEITASSVSGRLLLSASSVNHLQLDAVSNTTVFNENSTDQDFRVESNNNSHMLFVNAGLDQVVIGAGSISAPSGYHLFSYGSGSGARSAFVHGAGDGGIVVSGAAGGSAASVIFGNNWGTNGATFSEEYRLFMDGSDDSLKFNYNANASTAMELASNGFVSIGGDSPLTPLHVKYSGAGELLRLESTDAGAGLGPTIGLFRNSASPAPGDNLGAINFYGEDSVSNITTYAAIESETYGVTNGSEAGRLHFKVAQSASLVSRFYMNFGETVVNESGENIDFRIESDGLANIFNVDAARNEISMGHAVNTAYDALISMTVNDSSSMTDFATTLLLNDNTSTTAASGGSILFAGQDGTSSRGFSKIVGGKANSTSGNYEGSILFRTRVNGAADIGEALRMNGTAAVFNETSADRDFRVESDSYANAIFVNGSSGEVNFDGTRTNFGGINVDTADGEINAGLVKLRNSNTTSGQFLSIDAEGTSAGQSMTHYWYDGAYRNRFQVAGNTGETIVNEAGADVDFRVESDAHTDKIFVDASANNAYFSGQAQAEGPFIIGTKGTSGGMSVLKALQVSHVGTGPTSFTIQIATGSIGEYFAQIRIVGVGPFTATGYFSQLYELAGYGGTTNITTLTNTRSGAGTSLTFSNATQTAAYTQLPVSSNTASYRFTVIATFYSVAGATGAISIA